MHRPPTEFNSQQHRHIKGFTLIELLVAIAIIAILAAILIPAIGGVRQTANKAECVSRIRQLVIATKAYGNEHGGRAPHPNLTVDGEPSFSHAPHFYSEAAFEKTLKLYLEDRFAAMYCPSALSEDPNGTYDPQVQRVANKPNDFVSYQYFNGDSNGTNPTGKPKPEYNLLFRNTINAPEQYAMWGCLTYVTGSRTYGHMEGRSAGTTPEGMNAGYADGSVRWVPSEQLESYTEDGSYLWPKPNYN